jgi:hypothetical protein
LGIWQRLCPEILLGEAVVEASPLFYIGAMQTSKKVGIKSKLKTNFWNNFGIKILKNQLIQKTQQYYFNMARIFGLNWDLKDQFLRLLLLRKVSS